MTKAWIHLVFGIVAVTLAGCGHIHREGLTGARLEQLEGTMAQATPHLSPELEAQILALNPTNVTARDIREVLSQAPAPRIIKIHGGRAGVVSQMIKFSEFLHGMGYPAASLTNPGDGTYSFSCYEGSEKVAGVVAWYYEQEGLRPMLVGHSQGGMQVIKVLSRFSGRPDGLPVWNPLTWKREKRFEIFDPNTGCLRPASSLRVPFATSVCAGGLSRLLPNQWGMAFCLHDVPDAAEEFTAFCKGWDLLGGDYLGFGSINHFKPVGCAQVRNVWLPSEYQHDTIPATKHLLDNPEIVDWIQRYQPDPAAVSRPEAPHFWSDTSNLLWAAEVWFSVKKHWVLELQAAIRARHRLEAE